MQVRARLGGGEERGLGGGATLIGRVDRGGAVLYTFQSPAVEVLGGFEADLVEGALKIGREWRCIVRVRDLQRTGAVFEGIWVVLGSSICCTLLARWRKLDRLLEVRLKGCLLYTSDAADE